VERNYSYFLDKEGHLWHEGTEVKDPRFAYIVHRLLERTEDGRFLVRCQGENCWFEVEDVPYIVQDVAFHKTDGGRLRQVDLIFPGGYTEVLDPATLNVPENDVLYCKVRNGRFSARFNRKCFFQLAPFIEEDSERRQFLLEVNKKRYPILMTARTPG
jgi:hypothetical protein